MMVFISELLFFYIAVAFAVRRPNNACAGGGGQRHTPLKENLVWDSGAIQNGDVRGDIP